MTREIKFKGFCPNEKGTQEIWTDGTCNGEKVKGGIKGEWVEGYFFKIWHEYYILWGTTNGIPNTLEVIPETVGQWTGLTDKNEKKIFEHDRIKYKCGDIAEVIFTEYGAFVGETESLSHENIGGVLTEVIGTIFDKEADNGQR